MKSKIKSKQAAPSPSPESAVAVEGATPEPKAKRARARKQSTEAEPGSPAGPATDAPAAIEPESASEPVSAAIEPQPDAEPATQQEPATKPQRARGRKTKAEAAITLADLAERYIRSLEEQGRSDATVNAYKSDLVIAAKVLGGDTPIDTLAPADIVRFNESDAVLLTRTGARKAEPTLKRTQRVLRLALDYAEAEGVISVSPASEPTTSAF